MSIGYFPTIYEDELIYSALARFYAHSGYLYYTQFANDVYTEKVYRPDKEFFNILKPEIKEIIIKQMPWEDAVMKHTMYPYYSRFIDFDKKNRAKKLLIDMKDTCSDNLLKLLSVPIGRTVNKDYLKYCPYCSAEDRKIYGETYWHRRHQIRGLNFCYKHGCRLSESSIAICQCGEQLICAENEADTEEKEIDCSEFFALFAKYVIKVLEQKEYDTCIIGKNIEMKAKERYSKARKKKTDISDLNKDYHIWKKETGINGMFYGTQCLHILFSGQKRNPYDICELAFFLGISAEEMAYPKFKTEDAEPLEEQVEAMILEGRSIHYISKKLGISNIIIRIICAERNIHTVHISGKTWGEQIEAREQRILDEKKLWLQLKEQYPDKGYSELCEMKEYNSHLKYLRRVDKEWTDNNWFGRYRNKRDSKNWKKLDEETLPLLQNEIEKILDEDTSVKITYSLMERKLNLYKGIWKKLPQCKAVIESYRIS